MTISALMDLAQCTRRRASRTGFAVLALGLATACTSPQPQRNFDGDPAFRTTAPSRLFFNNVRSSAYYSERRKGTELDLYRNRKFSQTQKRPLLVPVIVNDWMNEEAFLFIRPNKFEGLGDPLSVRFTGDTISGTYTLDIPNKAAQYDFATDLFESIDRGDALAVMLADSTFVPIYESRAERGAFLTVMRDYYRLTERM